MIVNREHKFKRTPNQKFKSMFHYLDIDISDETIDDVCDSGKWDNPMVWFKSLNADSFINNLALATVLSNRIKGIIKHLERERNQHDNKTIL